MLQTSHFVDRKCLKMVYVHFGPKTLRTQDISALCLMPKCITFLRWFRSVHWTLSKTLWHLGQFGTKVHETLDPELDASSIAIVLRNVDPFSLL